MSDSHTIAIKPAPGERIESRLLLPDASEAAICAQVFHSDIEPAPGVLAVLISGKSGEILDHAVTDANGYFCFGSLPPDQLYIIHLHEKQRKIRVLEVSL